MAYFTVEQWVALSVTGAAGIIAILRVLADRFEHDRQLHDLRTRARLLRMDYDARMAALRAENGEAPIEVDVIEDAEPVVDVPARVAA